MNEVFICVILGISLVIVVTMLKMRKRDSPDEMFYGYAECEICKEVRIHKMLLNSGEVLLAECLACSVGEEKYNVLNGILIEHDKNNSERHKERILSWANDRSTS